MNGARIVLYRDRVAYVGATESGKSTLARVHFEAARCRRMLVDPKHSWLVRDVKPVREVAEIDWKASVIHFQPRWRDRAQADELYGAAFRRLRHALIWTDEADGISSSNWVGSAIESIQGQGRELEIGHLALFQRPVGVARELSTEATHIFLFGLIDDDDLKLVRRGASFVDLGELRAMLSALPPHGYVWLDRRAKKVTIGDPLPDHMRVPTLVFRRQGAE